MKPIFLIVFTFLLAFNSHQQVDDFIDDYDQGLQLSRETGKPILFIFTGLECANPLMLYELLKNDEQIKLKIKESYIPVVLYCDDRTKLPEEKTVIRDGQNFRIRTKGNLWTHMCISKFNSNTVPTILILDSDEQIIKAPVKGKITRELLLDYLYEQ